MKIIHNTTTDPKFIIVSLYRGLGEIELYPYSSRPNKDDSLCRIGMWHIKRK